MTDARTTFKTFTGPPGKCGDSTLQLYIWSQNPPGDGALIQITCLEPLIRGAGYRANRKEYHDRGNGSERKDRRLCGRAAAGKERQGPGDRAERAAPGEIHQTRRGSRSRRCDGYE